MLQKAENLDITKTRNNPFCIVQKVNTFLKAIGFQEGIASLAVDLKIDPDQLIEKIDLISSNIRLSELKELIDRKRSKAAVSKINIDVIVPLDWTDLDRDLKSCIFTKYIKLMDELRVCEGLSTGEQNALQRFNEIKNRELENQRGKTLSNQNSLHEITIYISKGGNRNMEVRRFARQVAGTVNRYVYLEKASTEVIARIEKALLIANYDWKLEEVAEIYKSYLSCQNTAPIGEIFPWAIDPDSIILEKQILIQESYRKLLVLGQIALASFNKVNGKLLLKDKEKNQQRQYINETLKGITEILDKSRIRLPREVTTFCP